MATNFPTSIDSFTNPTSGDTLDSPSHAAQHTNINDAMVAVQTRLGTGTGTIGETVTAWTPNFLTGVTVGNGTVSGAYQRVNNVVFVQGLFVLGSTSAITGDIRVDVPVTGQDLYQIAASTNVSFQDSSLNTFYLGAGFPFSTGQLRLRPVDVGAGTYAPSVAASNIIPFSWATGDRIIWTQTYRVG